MTDAYPLQWPSGWPRNKSRSKGPFKDKSVYRAAQEIHTELNRMKATQIVISSNLKLRKDGLPYSDQRTDDPGVCAYFKYNGRNQCIPCDRWAKIEDNMWAIAKSIEAMRGLERWGSKQIVDAAFTGFQQIAYVGKPIVRYFDDCFSKEDAKNRFRRYAIEMHPDAGGDTAEFAEMNRQYQEVAEK